MCFIKIELQCSRGVTAIALWPVIAKNCDALTHNYDKKIVVTRGYYTKISTMLQYVIVFLHFQFQLKCKSSATASFYLVSLPPVDEQWSSQERFRLFFHICYILQRIHMIQKVLMPIPFAKNSHILRFRKKFFAK